MKQLHRGMIDNTHTQRHTETGQGTEGISLLLEDINMQRQPAAGESSLPEQVETTTTDAYAFIDVHFLIVCVQTTFDDVVLIVVYVLILY